MLLRQRPLPEARKSLTDDQERIVARMIEVSHPQWMVMWGCYTRLFWAFPRFRVAPGTIVSSWSPQNLITDMKDVEDEFRASPRVPAYNSAPVAPLPRRVPLALRNVPPTGYDPLISAPVHPAGFDLDDSDDSDWDWSGSFWPDYPPQTSGPNYW
jgi:hypothetical protein